MKVNRFAKILLVLLIPVFVFVIVCCAAVPGHPVSVDVCCQVLMWSVPLLFFLIRFADVVVPIIGDERVRNRYQGYRQLLHKKYPDVVMPWGVGYICKAPAAARAYKRLLKQEKEVNVPVVLAEEHYIVFHTLGEAFGFVKQMENCGADVGIGFLD